MKDSNMIWKLSDVKSYKHIWQFCNHDYMDLFIDSPDEVWFNLFLNDVLDEIKLNNDAESEAVANEWIQSVSGMTTEEYDSYIEWSSTDYKFAPKEVWALLLPKDRTTLFDDSQEYFTKWYDSLSVTDSELYIDRVTSGKSIIPTDEIVEPKCKFIVEDPKSEIKIDSKLKLSVNMVNDKLVLTSTNLQILNSHKNSFVDNGNIPFEYRTKILDDVLYHTYVFEINSKT